MHGTQSRQLLIDESFSAIGIRHLARRRREMSGLPLSPWGTTGRRRATRNRHDASRSARFNYQTGPDLTRGNRTVPQTGCPQPETPVTTPPPIPPRSCRRLGADSPLSGDGEILAPRAARGSPEPSTPSEPFPFLPPRLCASARFLPAPGKGDSSLFRVGNLWRRVSRLGHRRYWHAGVNQRRGKEGVWGNLGPLVPPASAARTGTGGNHRPKVSPRAPLPFLFSVVDR